MSQEPVETAPNPDDDFLMLRRGQAAGVEIPAGLNLTAMMDMLTIILVYLVKVYADLPVNATAVKDLKPNETVLVSREEMGNGQLVMVAPQGVTVGSRPVAACAVPEGTPLNVAPRSACRLAVEAALNAGFKDAQSIADKTGGVVAFDKNVLLVVDQGVAYMDTLYVLDAAGEAKFESFQLITKQAPTASAGAKE